MRTRIQADRFIYVKFAALTLTFAALLFAPGASADAFYMCSKKGQPPTLANEAVVGTWKSQGWRCRKRMQFNDEAPRKKTSATTSGASTGGSTTRYSKPHFSGPAGEAQTFEGFIQEAAQRYNVPSSLVRAVIRVESNFRPRAVSSAGAKGLMQLMPGTASDMGASDVFNPRQNIFAGTRYLRVLINKFKGDAKLAIAAYHAGPGIVAARGRIPYKATERYVRSVLKHYLRYKEARL